MRSKHDAVEGTLRHGARRRLGCSLVALALLACGGEEQAPTLPTAPVEIVLDDQGIPHIYGQDDRDAFFGAGETLGARLGQAGCRPASTLLGVASLAFPELLVEIEATAAR